MLLPHTVRRGAVLLDLFGVLAIIGILVAITVPMMLQAADRSTRYRCAENLRQVGFALRRYADENNGRLPATRPACSPEVLPDVSNSGFASSDPFGTEGPGPNNVPSALFLLIREGYLSPATLVCPATRHRPDTFGGQPPWMRSNFTSVELNLSYAIQNPYADESAMAAGFRWDRSLTYPFVLAADKGPPPTVEGVDVLCLSPTSPPDQLRLANSTHHHGRGQNVLFADGSVEFCDNPLVGVNRDHIYASRRGRMLDSPVDATDNVLLPSGEPCADADN